MLKQKTSKKSPKKVKPKSMKKKAMFKIEWGDVSGSINKKLPLPGFEPGFSEPQSEVLTTILQ